MTKYVLPVPACLSFDEYPVYKGDDLELQYTPARSQFTVWSPAASQVRLNLYTTGVGGKPIAQLPMERAEKGTWQLAVEKDLKGYFYTFQIFMADKWLAETPGIWAKAVGINGLRAAVIDWHETNPEGWEQDRSPVLKSLADTVIYEMHHRDFSITANSGIRHKGKFLALTETDTTGPDGVATGIEHLKELGVTHVHLLPSFDYGSVDESRPQDNPYNWGYDPQNYNVPEGSYSTNPADPVARIREYKEMVRSLHKNGIRVIMDVVYNHTYGTDDSNFNLIAPGYFYRYHPDGSYSNASGCGNEIASEREMVREYIVRSVRYWAEEYHIDGFRFDLMGIHDLETMNRIKKELAQIDPTILVYGEGWTADESPLPADQRALKRNAPWMEGVAVFNDDLRDALKGSVFKDEQAGFVAGQVKGNEESIKLGIAGAIDHPQIQYQHLLYCDAPYATSPLQVINYASCHDNLCLVDKLKRSVSPAASPEELVKFAKLAQTIVFTSQGIPFMRAGEELLHDKKGVDNSYCSPDSVNGIDWSLKGINQDVFDYYKKLITLRKTHPAFRLSTADAVRQSLRFLENMPEGVVGYTLDGHAGGDSWKEILVVFNGNRQITPVSLPEGTWNLICYEGKIDVSGLGSIQGGENQLAASSALIGWR